MKKLLILIVLLFNTFLQAQPTINTTLTPKQLVENVLILPSSAVVASNIKFNGTAANALLVRDQAAMWQTNFNPSLGMGSNQTAIILTTGNALVAMGPNNSGSKTQASVTPQIGDMDLAALSGFNIQNAAVLEFDFVASDMELNLDYIFASEEYPELANAANNDVFGIFLNGPGISGIFTNNSKNIALIPNSGPSSLPVTINNLNNGITNSGPCEYCSNYTNNGIGETSLLNPDSQYDGLTKKMTAKSSLQIGGTYHIKIAIANTNNNSSDSGLFLADLRVLPSSDNIKLIAFIDNNANGIKDVNEVNYPQGSFIYQKNNIETPVNIFSPTGNYTLYDNNPLNTYDFSYQINPEYAAYFSATATNFNDLNVPIDGGTQTLYFPITSTGYNDVSVTIIPNSPPIPGMNYTNTIEYKNLGFPSSCSGTITFTKPALATINTVSQSGIINTLTGFTYDFTNLEQGESGFIVVSMSVPTIPTVNIGDILTTSASITAPTNDINLTNNTFTNNQIVVGSYDPNDKMEAHGEKILFSSFAANEYLTYTIRFQNTGTANAINVRLEDVLHSKLNPASIRMVSASHNYIMTRVNNAVTWKFDDIQLPYASLNEALSNGYVTFQIKLLPGFALGDIVPNHADIYFDMNPAIITNTFNTEFVATLETVTFNPENILIYPNPSNDVINIRLENTMENLESVVLYDVVGKSVLKTINIDSNQSTIDVSALAKGLYLVEIITENQLKMTKKLMVK